MPKFRCEHCNQKIAAPDAYVGRRVRCPRCKKPAKVPKGAESTAELAPSVVSAPQEPESQPIPPASPAVSRAARVEPPAPEPVVAPPLEQEPPPLFSEWMSGPAAEIEPAPPPQEEPHSVEVTSEPHDPWGQPPVEEHPHDEYQEEPEPQFEPAAEIVVPPSEVIDRPVRRRQASNSADEVANLLRDLKPSAEVAVEQFATAAVGSTHSAPTPASVAGMVRVLAWASIGMGVIAIAMGFLSALSPVAVPVGSAGLLLALVGVFLATTRRPTRLRVLLGGAMASAAGITVAILGASGILPIGAKDAVLRAGSTPPVNVVANEPSAGTEGPVASVVYIPATSPAIANHVEIRVASAQVLQPVVYTGDYSSLNTISERKMQIRLELKALGSSDVTYEPWRKNGASGAEPKLTDSQGKQLPIDVAPNRADVAATLPVGSLKGPTQLHPGNRAGDVLLFEPPDNPHEDLKLDLPGANIGAPNTTVHIRIPAGMVAVQAQ